MLVAQVDRLHKQKGYKCLFCLIISSQCLERRLETLHIYESQESRERGMNHYRRGSVLKDTVFFTFEIPIDFYLEKAEKQI